MTIALYLMNKKGRQTLDRLCREFHSEVFSAVICSRDVNVENDYYDDIKDLCEQYKINFIDRSEDKGAYSKSYRIAIGWRWIIPSTDKLIIFHDSLLPKYRGFSPLVNALINGETKIGVTALFASEEFDRGEIILQKRVNINYPICIADAISEVSKLYQDMAVEVVSAIQVNKLEGTPQDESEASYSIWRDKDDYHINWSDSAENVVRFIDALGYPYQGAFTWLDGIKATIVKAVEVDDVNLEHRHIGKVIFYDDECPIIIAQSGLVKVEELIDTNGQSLLPLNNYRVRFN